MKRVLSIALVLVFVLMLVACGGSSSSSAVASVSETATSSSVAAASGSVASKSANTGDGEPLSVALLMPGPINDLGWNSKAYNGLMMIQDELGAEVQFSENVQAADFEEVFRGYAEMGCDLIIGHGFQFGDAAKAVAPSYPDTMFAITSTDISQAPNVCGLLNKNLEQGFIAGLVAGLESKSGIVGCVGGSEMPPVVAYVEGFKQGAAYINPDIKVLANYTGNMDDAAAAKQMTEAMIKEGADIITHDANAAGLGAFEAVTEAPEEVKIIGCIDDQHELAPDRTITSAMNKVDTSLLLAAQYLQEGNLEPQTYYFGVAEGTIFLADFYDYPISDENKAKLEDAQEKLANGEITVEM